MAKNDKKNDAKISKNNKKSTYQAPNFRKLKTETKYTIWAVVFFVIALFLFMSLPIFDLAGNGGKSVYDFLDYLFGFGYILVPILFVMLGWSFIKSQRPNIGWMRGISGVTFLLSGLGILAIPSKNNAGGLFGDLVSSPLVSIFDVYASIIFLGAILIISILVMFDTRPELMPMFRRITSIFRKKDQEDYENDIYENENDYEEEETEDEEENEKSENEEGSAGDKIKKVLGIGKKEEEVVASVEQEEEIPIKKRKSHIVSTYTPPPMNLLEEDRGKPNTGDTKGNSNIIKRTLANFGIEVEMDEITVGPTVTRYALKPAEGVKLSRIVGLQNDLALALAAHPIRIEAPIPGKSLVGIEIPNKSKSIVGLATLLSDEKYKNTDKILTVALGRGLSGKAVFGNLAKMPHCLVAGTTGSGKSVTIHAMIASLLYKNGPDDLKFIMVDPKRVELTLYNKIPHLLTPVITDAKKTILALKWAAKEMDRRYDILEAESVRDIESYHENILSRKKVRVKENGEEEEVEADHMPYIVVIIDELADIMTAYPRELEAAIVRLAQMSRAVGIHLILSTQRPEVNVITGLIKANIPSRVALKVSSQIDSRTILDAGGAEKLLGAGDMLYSSGEAQPERLQSAFISEQEVKKVVKYLADAYKDEVMEEIAIGSGSISADKSIFESVLEDEKQDEEDEMYEEARACVIESGKASTSYLQRRLGLGYARAARIMDMLESRGVVGPADGAKPREILEKINRDENGNNVI